MKNHVDLLNEITNAGLDTNHERAIQRLDTLTGKIRNNLETDEYNLGDAEELACQSNINLIRTYVEATLNKQVAGEYVDACRTE